MHQRVRLALIGSLAVVFPLRPTAGQSAPATGGPAPHPLGAVVAKSTKLFQQISGLVTERDGRVFLSDGRARVVYQLDSTLTNARVVLDSTSGRANTFSANSVLFPFRADSVMFFDQKPAVLVVIDPNGTLGRTMAPPSGPTGFGLQFGSGLSSYLGAGPATTRAAVHEDGPLGTSKTLGIVYRVGGDAPPLAPTPPSGQPPNVLRYEDSLLVMRWNADTRAVDTVGRLSTGRTYIRVISADSNRTTGARNLFMFIDDATVTSDGSIALFHARDYRIDWVNPNGTRTTGPRIAFDWQRITDDGRAHVVDSINTLNRHRYDSVMAKRAADSARTGLPPMTMVTQMSADGERTQRQVPARPPAVPSLVELGDVPDFFPPTSRASLLADADNHVWIKHFPSPNTDLPAIWDIVDRSGVLVDRVSIPTSQTVVGFAPGGFVYVTVSDAGKVQLIKSKVR